MFKFLLEENTSKESFDFVKVVLDRCDLIHRFRFVIELKERQYKISSQIIPSYEEVPMRSIDRKEVKQLILNNTPRKPKAAAMEVEPEPVRFSKTPEKKRSPAKARREL